MSIAIHASCRPPIAVKSARVVGTIELAVAAAALHAGLPESNLHLPNHRRQPKSLARFLPGKWNPCSVGNGPPRSLCVSHPCKLRIAPQNSRWQPMADSTTPPQVDDDACLTKDEQPGPDNKPKLAELSESRTELLSRVQSLRKDLQEWRGRLDRQVKAYRQELGELRSTLNTEVEQLRTEFQDLRGALKKQLDATSGLAAKAPELPKFPTGA